MNIDGKTKLYAFIAHPCEHTASPTMHNIAFEELNINARYLAFDVDNNNLEKVIEGFKAMKVAGGNVSMPNKQNIIPYLDKVTLRAKLANAVNTIKLNENGGYDGDLTDGYGFQECLNQKGWDIKNKKIVILGAGGASQATIVQLALEGAKQIVVYNRSYKESFMNIIDNVIKETNCDITFTLLEDLSKLKKDLTDAYLLINTTGVGMHPYEEECLIPDSGYLPTGLKVADIIYQPEYTKLLKMAKDKGLDVVNGKLMLLYQGVEAFRVWTGQDMPIRKVKKAIGVE